MRERKQGVRATVSSGNACWGTRHEFSNSLMTTAVEPTRRLDARLRSRGAVVAQAAEESLQSFADSVPALRILTSLSPGQAG